MVAHNVPYPNWRELAEEEGWLHWVRSPADEHAAANGYWFEEDDALIWVNFFNSVLVHTRGELAGKPFTLLDWQRDDVIMPLFGWTHRETGLRRYRKGAIWIPKKNGKSTLAGAIVNAFLHLSGERAECYGFAHTAKQAAIVFREAAAFAEKSPFLQQNSRVVESRNRITVPYNDSFYEAREGEAGSRASEGINPVLVIFDELHVQRSRELFDSLTYACAAQREALVLSISTVGVADETTIWWEQYDYCRKIVAGEIFDDAFFAYIAKADDECKDNIDMLLDPVQQRKANPSLDAPGCPTSEELTQAVIEAKNSPRKINNLLRYRFNIPTAQIDRVVNMEAWKRCEGKLPDLRSIRCFGGLDLASTEDLAAFVLAFPPSVDEGLWYLKAWFWCPEEKMREREQRQMMHYVNWHREGWLKITPGKRINYKVIVADIQKILQSYRVECSGYDKWNAEAAIQDLELDSDWVEVNQSIRGMTQGTKTLLDIIEEGRVRHEGNPVLTWCLGNCAADPRSNEEYIRFSKEHSADKIDGAVGAAIACGLGVLAEPETESIYSEPGGLFL